MNLYSVKSSHLREISPRPFKLERDIQSLVEKNISVLFGLEFICTGFSIGGLRIYTLAYDLERKAFVIIEYKKCHSYSVVDQGYSYLSLLLNNKADFVLEYFERSGNPLRKQEVDWSQSRVIFVSPEFSKYEMQSIEFKNLLFGLWKIKG